MWRFVLRLSVTITVVMIMQTTYHHVEAQDSLNVTLLSRYETGGDVRDVFVSEDYAYLADSKGLTVLDVQDPRNPFRVSLVDSISARCVYVVDSLAYVGGRTSSMRAMFCIYDISDPSFLRLMSPYVSLEDLPWDIFVSGSYAYIAEQLAGLEIIDIQKPEAPSEVAEFQQWCNWATISASFVREPFAFVAGQDCFSIFFIEDKTNPLRVSEIEMGGQLVSPASDVIVSGGLAYIAHLAFGLVIVDITHVIAPKSLYPIGWGSGLHGGGIDVADNKCAYLGTENKGLRIFDVNDPSNPFEVGYYRTEGQAGRVTVKDGVVFLASGTGGLYILQNELLTSVNDEGRDQPSRGFQLCQNHPNPFNATTCIQYSLINDQPPAYVTLKIYNLLGEEVQTLVREERQSGSYTVTWDGKDKVGNEVATGVYLYRLAVYGKSLRKWTETRKLLLVR